GNVPLRRPGAGAIVAGLSSVPDRGHRGADAGNRAVRNAANPCQTLAGLLQAKSHWPGIAGRAKLDWMVPGWIAGRSIGRGMPDAGIWPALAEICGNGRARFCVPSRKPSPVAGRCHNLVRRLWEHGQRRARAVRRGRMREGKRSMSVMSRRILVTGGAGFLGSHLCERLVAAGHDVLCIDNYFIGRRANVAHLIGHPRFEIMRHDVTFPLYVEVDEIYNLACPASPIHYQHDPVQTTKTSVHGAINMLGLAKRLRAKILQASTSEVYGDPTVHPQTESYWGNVNPIGFRS